MSCISKKYYIFLMACFLIVSVQLWSTNVLAEGTVIAGYEITSPITGLVKKVHVTSGQTVKKGELLLEFDSDLIMSNLLAAKAKLSFEQLNQVEAKKEFERAEELYDRTVLSEQELQQAQILYSKAKAQYATAKNKLVHVQWHLDHTKLYATFSGKVEQVFSYPGQFVNNKLSAQTLLIIQSL